MKMDARRRWIGAALALASMFSAAHTFADGARPLQCSAQAGASQADLEAFAENIRSRDGFYKQLIQWKGLPSRCTGSVASEASGDEGWIEYTWPDKSTFKSEFMAPESFRVTYSGPNGLTRAADIVARFRDYASQSGLRIDWNAARTETVGGLRTVEYSDKDPGINGFVWFTYDNKNRLMAASLSIAL